MQYLSLAKENIRKYGHRIAKEKVGAIAYIVAEAITVVGIALLAVVWFSIAI